MAKIAIAASIFVLTTLATIGESQNSFGIPIAKLSMHLLPATATNREEGGSEDRRSETKREPWNFGVPIVKLSMHPLPKIATNQEEGGSENRSSETKGKPWEFLHGLGRLATLTERHADATSPQPESPAPPPPPPPPTPTSHITFPPRLSPDFTQRSTAKEKRMEPVLLLLIVSAPFIALLALAVFFCSEGAVGERKRVSREAILGLCKNKPQEQTFSDSLAPK